MDLNTSSEKGSVRTLRFPLLRGSPCDFSAKDAKVNALLCLETFGISLWYRDSQSFELTRVGLVNSGSPVRLARLCNYSVSVDQDSSWSVYLHENEA